MSLTYSFSGKRVLITGGGQGIGRQLVKRFYDEGAVVFTIDKNEELVVKLLKEFPGVTAEIVDLADWKATNRAVQGFGFLDHLVNNAAVVIPQHLKNITEDVAALQYGVNVGAVINVTQIVAKGMMECGSGGTIVNISSLGARISHPLIACYAASKAALENLTKSMALELGPSNIRVNCVLPGSVDTDNSICKSQLPPEVLQMMEWYIQKQVIKRNMDMNEIADLVLFLLSPLSGMIVGQGIIIDGGCSLS